MRPPPQKSPPRPHHVGGGLQNQPGLLPPLLPVVALKGLSGSLPRGKGVKRLPGTEGLPCHPHHPHQGEEALGPLRRGATEGRRASSCLSLAPSQNPGGSCDSACPAPEFCPGGTGPAFCPTGLRSPGWTCGLWDVAPGVPSLKLSVDRSPSHEGLLGDFPQCRLGLTETGASGRWPPKAPPLSFSNHQTDEVGLPSDLHPFRAPMLFSPFGGQCVVTTTRYIPTTTATEGLAATVNSLKGAGEGTERPGRSVLLWKA